MNALDRRTVRRSVLALLGVSVAFAACTLNPQPLPPGDLAGEATSDYDAGTRADAGGFNGPEANADAATGPGREGGADDAGDGGDAGESGDAGDGGDSGDAGPDAG
jgi:hypothetical protein